MRAIKYYSTLEIVLLMLVYILDRRCISSHLFNQVPAIRNLSYFYFVQTPITEEMDDLTGTLTISSMRLTPFKAYESLNTKLLDLNTIPTHWSINRY